MTQSPRRKLTVLRHRLPHPPPEPIWGHEPPAFRASPASPSSMGKRVELAHEPPPASFPSNLGGGGGSDHPLSPRSAMMSQLNSSSYAGGGTPPPQVLLPSNKKHPVHTPGSLPQKLPHRSQSPPPQSCPSVVQQHIRSVIDTETDSFSAAAAASAASAAGWRGWHHQVCSVLQAAGSPAPRCFPAAPPGRVQ
jgi:hypothetical protein